MNDTSTALIRYIEPSDLTFNPFNRAFGATQPNQRRIGVTRAIASKLVKKYKKLFNSWIGFTTPNDLAIVGGQQ